MSQCTPMLSMSGTFLSNQILPIKGKWEALKQRKLNISDLRENDPNEGAQKAVEPEIDVVSMQGKANTSLRELLEGPEQQLQVEDVMINLNVNKQEICSRNVNMYVVEPSTSAPSTVVSAPDDEMLSWLHYPVDENFERSYCSEMFGDVSNSGMQQSLPLRRSQQMVTNSTSVVSLAPKPPNAEAAMAMGAERAAGLCSQVGLEAFCRVRTSSQPPVPKWLPPPPATTTDIVTVHDQQPLKSVCNFPLYSSPMATASSNMLVLKEQGSSKAADKSISLMAESTSPKQKQRQENVEAVLRKTPVKKEQPGSLTSAGGSSSCRTKSFENDDFHNVQRKYEPEPTITSSSGGSENTTEKSEKAERAKRKAKQIDSAECCQSEDVEAESVDTKKKTTTRPKRSRAAEVHNLSERRRRDRINEKMRALQELIPNSNKTDKASMLDEAIEYLKMLQVQLQMMSMRSGMSMPPMVMPNGVQQHLQMPQMPQLAPYGMGMGMVGMNMGMGMGMGMNMVDLANSSIRPIVSEPLQQQQHHQQQQQQQLLGDSYNVFVSQQQMQVPVQMMSREMYNSYMLPQLNQPNHHHQDNQQQQQQQLHEIHHHSTGFNQ